MKLLFRILLLAACAVIIAVLAGDSLAAPSIYRPQLDRNGSLAIVQGLDEGTIFLTHVDGSDRESFRAGEEPSWSPNGKRIAYTDGSDVRVVDADGKNDTLITTGGDPSWTPAGDLLVSSDGDIVRIPMPAGAPVNLTNTLGVDETQPAASPDGQWIAFTSNQDVNDPSTPLAQTDYNLWIMNTTDLIAGQSLLWESSSGNYRGFPTWAPDSHRLAFADGGDIWTTPPIANNQTNLTNDALGQGYPAWSPDGKLVAYAEAATGDPDGSKPSTIWTIDVDSSARKQVTADPAQQDTSPDWQTWRVQNGRIAFFAQAGVSFYTGSMTASGEHLTSYIEAPGLVLLDMQFAPNGHQIALMTNNPTSSIVVINDIGAFDPTWSGPSTTVTPRSFGWFPDSAHMVWQNDTDDLLDVRPGLNPVNLTETQNVKEFQPAVSPDGMHIAFFSDQLPGSDPPVSSNVTGLWTMDFDGLDRQFVTLIQLPQFSNPVGHVISWSPDSSQIAYVSNSDVWTIPAAGGTPTNQTDDSLLQRDISWAPDGGLIAYDQGVLGDSNIQIWTIDPISGVRNRVSPAIPDSAFALPTWQPLWAPNSDRFYVWGDTHCDGLPDLRDLLDILKGIAGSPVSHTPGCPSIGDIGLNSANKSGPWGGVTCGSQLSSADVLNFLAYLLDIRNHAPPPRQDDTAGALSPECPPIGSYTEFIPVS